MLGLILQTQIRHEGGVQLLLNTLPASRPALCCLQLRHPRGSQTPPQFLHENTSPAGQISGFLSLHSFHLSLSFPTSKMCPFLSPLHSLLLWVSASPKLPGSLSKWGREAGPTQRLTGARQSEPCLSALQRASGTGAPREQQVHHDAETFVAAGHGACPSQRPPPTATERHPHCFSLHTVGS